ncbi:hypothetical protein HK096_005717, partial [Nowakowskiella sp. JEL0078]
MYNTQICGQTPECVTCTKTISKTTNANFVDLCVFVRIYPNIVSFLSGCNKKYYYFALLSNLLNWVPTPLTREAMSTSSQNPDHSSKYSPYDIYCNPRVHAHTHSNKISNCWLFSPEELAWPPAVVQDGIKIEADADCRFKASQYIYNVAMCLHEQKLKLKPHVIATAETLMHRFYMRSTWKQTPYKKLAVTALFAAIKACDIHVRIKDVLRAWYLSDWKFFNPNGTGPQTLNETAEQYKTMRDDIIRQEDWLGYMLCFDFEVETAHKTFINLMKEFKASDHCVATGMKILNDSYRTTLCLRYSHEVIANAVAYMTIKLAADDSFIPPEEKVWEKYADFLP